MKKTIRLGGFCLALIMAVSGWSQEKPVSPPGYYRLDFLVKEVEGGKTMNARAYSMEISTDPHNGIVSSIRSGSKVPVPAKDGTFTYMELGVNIDCRSAKEVDGELSLTISADISNLADPSPNPPLIRQTKWGANVIVPVRKATVVFSSDDAMSKRQMQLELTASPVK